MNCRCLLAFLVISAPLLAKGEAIVDQENWGVHIDITYGISQQQEFTPTLNALDSVQLWVPGGDLSILNPVGYLPGVSVLNIREGGIDGPIVATSNPAHNVAFYHGPVGFGFSEPVPLVPGELYALEPLWISGGGGVFASSLTGQYARGRLYADGEFVDADLLFREGIGLDLIPEPSPSILLASAGLIWAFGFALLSLRRARNRAGAVR